ncbi:HEAT repeat domain-containing protein [Actinomadura harenae]|uniref:HEAT repeat domain-containing protein n=1 Tax=Actinomadura harenae TaxID=2483351 RepID=A0A3M2M5C2_9ACTN|nr:HEAT repeat domain-containing protein [Actinomadura harenae]RMI42318.1 HEAT repeat domain-containing protein [Actinomadura harenae]
MPADPDAIDWSSLVHADGSAEDVPALLSALRSSDADERNEAISDFYLKLFPFGRVFDSTAASLPFLLEHAEDVTAPGRDWVVPILVEIGEESAEGCAGAHGPDAAEVEALVILREHAGVFVELTSAPDSRLRQAAFRGVALFLDDPAQAAAVLRSRLPDADASIERRLLVEAMASLALRTPAVSEQARAWLDQVASDDDADLETRLAAAVQRVRCTPAQIGEDAVPAAIDLLRRMKPYDARLLHTIHDTLDGRTPQRTALITEYLSDPHPRARRDALRMSKELMCSWRGDHTGLISRVADRLDDRHLAVSADAAAVLHSCHALIGPVRETLAAYVAAQRTSHGPGVWAAPQWHLRWAHQEAVCALARRGDLRALPSLLVALDSGVDDWRAVEVAGCLPEGGDQLVPRLIPLLDQVTAAARPHDRTSFYAMLSALAVFGDEAALPALIRALDTAMDGAAHAVLRALGSFGPAASGVLDRIRPLTTESDIHVRRAAIAALWSIGRDLDEALPLLQGLLDEPFDFAVAEAADILGQIGPPAAVAVPRLRELLTHSWLGARFASALWEIGGPPETRAVLDTLLHGWVNDPETTDKVVTCLDRMGTAAESVLPRLRDELRRTRRCENWSVDNDERLQRQYRAIIERLS